MGKRKTIKIIAVFILLSQFSACFYMTGEQLFDPPQMPKDYENLQTEINKILAEGAEYSAPTAGLNRSAVQKADIDGDGIFEGVAFFRTNEEKPLKIYVFKLKGEVYEIMAKIESEGEAFDSVVYSDLANTGSRQIIAGCMVGAGSIKAVNVYSIGTEGVNTLLSTNCTGFAVHDIDGDEDRELLVVHNETSEIGGRVDLYKYDSKVMALLATAPLSKGIERITRIKTGDLLSAVPALYIAGTYEKTSIVTDIFAFQSGVFKNILLNKDTGLSDETLRNYVVYATNMDDDNVIDLPQPVRMPVYEEFKTGEDFWQINWRSYGVDGYARTVMSTFHNFNEGWYLVLPQSWINNITIFRQDIHSGERRLIIARWNGNTKRPEPFLAIYTLTSENREERALVGDRFTVKADSYTIYAAEFLDNNLSDAFLTDEETIKNNFKYIQSEWVSGEMYN